jgi:uncharacterized membrane protein YbhN (UPF0104 family)
VCGVVAVGSIVRAIGPATIGRVLLSAGIFLPLLMLLEAVWMGMDVFVLRALLGDHARKAPWIAYARSGVTAYAITVFFPMGRASAEVTRAAMLSPHLGPSRVALAAMQVQGASMLGTTLISLCALVATSQRLGPTDRLALAIGTSALLTGSLGAALLFGSRSSRLWAFLRRRIERLASVDPTAQDPSMRWGRAVLLSFVGRSIQCLLFTTAVYAAASVSSLATGAIAQGVSIAGSTFGDAVPQQVGVAEGAFYYFAGALGLGGSPAKAVAIVILVRVCQLSLAACCLVAGFFWKERSRI